MVQMMFCQGYDPLKLKLVFYFQKIKQIETAATTADTAVVVTYYIKTTQT